MTSERRRWLALVVVCLAQLMIVLDTTIVNVALPSIQHDLHFTQGNLTWVINAFLVTFGSFLLLAGRLGDLIGRKRVFLFGVTLFTFASLLCGAASTSTMLVAARFIQGIGAAMQASVILAIIVIEFPEPGDRARAMSAYMFTAVAGGSLGLLAGGVLTQLLSWHWIFFVNLPIGIVAVIAGRMLIPADRGLGLAQGVDWLGSALVTVSRSGPPCTRSSRRPATAGARRSRARRGRFGGRAAGALRRTRGTHRQPDHAASDPQAARSGRHLPHARVPRDRHVRTWFLGTLYLEHVLHYDAIRTGLAFMPWTLTVLALSLGITRAWLPGSGAVPVMLSGMALVALGLYQMHGIALHTDYFPRLALGLFLIGLGIGNSVHADADDRDGRRSAAGRRACARESSTSPSRSRAHSGWRC